MRRSHWLRPDDWSGLSAEASCSYTLAFKQSYVTTEAGAICALHYLSMVQLWSNIDLATFFGFIFIVLVIPSLSSSSSSPPSPPTVKGGTSRLGSVIAAPRISPFVIGSLGDPSVPFSNNLKSCQLSWTPLTDLSLDGSKLSLRRT
jgi:hypothetical protein